MVTFVKTELRLLEQSMQIQLCFEKSRKLPEFYCYDINNLLRVKNHTKGF